jgi:hypothetical protein
VTSSPSSAHGSCATSSFHARLLLGFNVSPPCDHERAAQKRSAECLDLLTCILNSPEQMGVETFISELTVEALDEVIFDWLSL